MLIPVPPSRVRAQQHSTRKLHVGTTLRLMLVWARSRHNSEWSLTNVGSGEPPPDQPAVTQSMKELVLTFCTGNGAIHS
jgi:hypothetical protein